MVHLPNTGLSDGGSSTITPAGEVAVGAADVVLLERMHAQQQGGAREHRGAVRGPELAVALVDPERAGVVHLDREIVPVGQHGTEVA